MGHGDGVKVVVPHYGDPALTLALLDQLAGCSTPVQWLVVDDASPTPFPDVAGVQVVRRTTNGGFGAAVNSGAAQAVHPLLLILNSDLRVRPGFVDDIVAEAGAHQPCVAGPAVVTPIGYPVATGRMFPTVGHQVVEWLTPLARFGSRVWWQRAVGHDLRALPGATVEVDWLIGAALLVPTGVFRAAGGFDERFFMNGEEVDLQRRLHQHGIGSVYLGRVRVQHPGGGSSDPRLRRRWLVSARLTYADTWGGRRRLRAALTAASVVNLAANLARRATGAQVHPVRTLRNELALLRR